MGISPLGRLGQSYTFIRYAPPSWSMGQAVPATEVLDNGQPWTFWGVVQPLTGFKVLYLPEGFRNTAAITIWTTTLLNLADEARKLLGDRLLWNGYWYEVTFRQDWTATPLDLPHYQYQAFKVANK